MYSVAGVCGRMVGGSSDKNMSENTNTASIVGGLRPYDPNEDKAEGYYGLSHEFVE